MVEDVPFARRLDALARRVLGGPVAAPTRLTGGASLELWSFEVGGLGYVLRRLPDARRFAGMGTVSPSTEAGVIDAVAAMGVPVPGIAYVLRPDDGLGDGFVASREPGEALGRRIVADPALAGIRPRLARMCGDVLARIAACPPSTLPSLAERTPAQGLDLLEAQWAAFGEPRPVFAAALAWLRRTCPAPTPPQLDHGDFRTGNFLVTPDGISAVLDWEATHLGDPAEDLGWLTMPVWRFGRIDRPCGGFGTRDDLYAGYRAAGGEVDRARVDWWQVRGTLRWGLTCMAMAAAFAGGDRSIERAAVGRRASEAELELLIALTRGID